MAQPQPNIFVNNEVARLLAPSLGRQNMQSYSGIDIQAILYLPNSTASSIKGVSTPKFKVFGELQTLSISSTRSISPVRVFGRSSPLAYTRGARTFAGTMVFASVNQDVFADVYDESIAESTLAASTSMMSDQLPPFSIIINASNEKGGAAIHAIHGITLVNYGTTYSVDDLYTEVVYSYVATDVLPLISTSVSVKRANTDEKITHNGFANVSDKILASLKKAYNTTETYIASARRYIDRLNNQ